MSSQLVYWLKVVSLGMILGLSIQFAEAWTNPTQTAPNGNIAGPLTTGSISQTKAGGNISLAGGGSLYAGGVVAAPQLCIGGDCRSAWPSGGGSGDNLGNHSAVQNLIMNNYDISGVRDITVSHDIGVSNNAWVNGAVYSNHIYSNNDVRGSSFCINGDCRSAWPSEGAVSCDWNGWVMPYLTNPNGECAYVGYFCSGGKITQMHLYSGHSWCVGNIVW